MADLGIDDGVVDVLIDHCGREALCSAMGLDSGDVLSVPVDATTMLEAGEPVVIHVTAPNGPPVPMTVVVVPSLT